MFLEIRGIRKSFGEGDSLVEVLKGIDLSVEKGEFCVLLGPSGSSLSRYFLWILIIPGISEPPVRTLRATIPENERHIFR